MNFNFPTLWDFTFRIIWNKKHSPFNENKLSIQKNAAISCFPAMRQNGAILYSGAGPLQKDFQRYSSAHLSTSFALGWISRQSFLCLACLLSQNCCWTCLMPLKSVSWPGNSATIAGSNAEPSLSLILDDRFANLAQGPGARKASLWKCATLSLFCCAPLRHWDSLRQICS